MLFNSQAYAIFLPIVVITFYLIPHNKRWILLLLASYWFYMSWEPGYILLIMASTLVDYSVAKKMGRLPTKAQRKPWLWGSLIINLGLLGVFKYFNFFSNSIETALGSFNILFDAPQLEFLLPVGISFYTFQTLSYSIEVYRGNQQPETHLGVFALYVSFFPQLVAGPIERSTKLLPQLHLSHSYNYTNISLGLRQILWGIFKKVVIADRAAVYVNQVFGEVGEANAIQALLAMYFFSIQIYCDFSGYSDIAIGSARLMNIELMRNFKTPYFSKSIREFWARWHISLSTWFRDYVYIPLGGNRVSLQRWLLNLMIVFLVSGLWHGANWTFVFWGALHGSLIVISSVLSQYNIKIFGRSSQFKHYLAIFCTFHWVTFAWVFFRAETLPHAFNMLSRLFVFTADSSLWQSVYSPIDTLPEFSILIVAVLFLLSVEWKIGQQKLTTAIGQLSVLKRWSWYYAIALAILFFGVFERSEFIYFQF